MIRPEWYWQALVAWLWAAGLTGTVWAFLGYRAKTRRTHTPDTPEEGTR